MHSDKQLMLDQIGQTFGNVSDAIDQLGDFKSSGTHMTILSSVYDKLRTAEGQLAQILDDDWWDR